MKDFSHYQYVRGEGYPNRLEKAKQLKAEINAAKMTAKERQEALDKVGKQSTEWFEEAVKPFMEIERNLITEFWQDCREDMGYTEFLNQFGVEAIEQKAYRDGHSHGFYEIYHTLDNLVDFAKLMIQERKEPT